MTPARKSGCILPQTSDPRFLSSVPESTVLWQSFSASATLKLEALSPAPVSLACRPDLGVTHHDRSHLATDLPRESRHRFTGSRRGRAVALGTARAQPPDAKILGAEGVKTSTRPKKVWQPLSDRRIRVGIVGYGVCQTERRPHLPGGRFAGGSPDSTPCATRGGRGPECAQDTLAPAACRWPARSGMAA